MKTRKILALVLSLVMVLGLCGTAFAWHPTDEVSELEAYNSDLSVEIATQGYVLLENNGLLPLAKEGKIALYGNGVAYTVKGGTGSGAVNNRNNKYGVNGDNIADAFIDAGWEVTNPNYVDSVRLQNNGRRYTGVQAARAITDAQIAEGQDADIGLYIVSRNAGEFSDRVRTNATSGYELTATERTNIEKVAAAYDKFIVVYNTCVMDAAWQDEVENIDAVVYMNNGGQRGSEALVKCLTGEVTFSGKLGDTWPKSYLDYPSTAGFANNDGNTATEYYVEGIYVGYRYFDTFGYDVCYPFGYGLSYTDFKIDVLETAITGEKVSVKVAVTNTGDYSGKEVVQVYFSAPDGTLEKPYQELAAFGKTDKLNPGQTQIMTISYDTADMSSYSEARAAYIMEAGNYIIRVGNSSRNTHVAAVGTLASTVVTEQLINQFKLEDPSKLTEISKAGATPITYEGEAEEIANAPKIAIVDVPTIVNDQYNDEETITTYLFEEDAENYVARDKITLQTRTVAGIIRNASNPNGPQFRGYSTTTYKEVPEIVDPLPEGITKANAKLTDVYNGKITLEQFVACMTAQELARLCVGGAGNVQPNPDGTMIGISADSVRGGAGQTTKELFETRHIPAMPNADGPAGIRITQNYQNREYQFCTAFPAGTLMAMTWDTDVIKSEGYAIGAEMKDYGVTTWLAPGMNIHRNPLCGRNFEYYSEDPYLCGMAAASVTLGVQSHSGIGVTLKHFWGNSQETNRNAENNVISERAAREIYLKGFEIAVKLAQPQCVMNSYNVNAGWPASDCWDTNEDLLRSEWGFKGYVMTDWGGGQSTAYIAKHGGCDMVMPGGNASAILNGYGIVQPTFNSNGSIRNAGTFVVKAGGSVGIVTSTDVESEEFLPANVAASVAAEEARYDKIGDDATITWYGEWEGVNRICLGDLQKSAMRVLRVALLSQNEENLLEGLGIDYTAGSYSANSEAAALEEDYAPVVKEAVKNMAVVADTVTVNVAETKTASVNVFYNGEDDVTSVRLYLDTALPIKDIESDNDFEINEDGRIVVYKGDGSPIDKTLFTLTFDLVNEDGWLKDGEYPITLELIEATIDEELVFVATIDGAVIVDNTYAKGDVTQDGEFDNADLILIARYLVGLVEFNEKQMEAADYNDDTLINNVDLVLIARALVEA